MKSNLVKNEIDRDNRILVVYHDYRLFGWILMVASLLPLTTLLAMPSPAISVVLVLMGGIPLAVGANLVFKERRRLWNRNSQSVESESRWPGKPFKRYKSEPIRNFEDIQIPGMPTTNRPGPRGSPPGVMVRMRHKRDSANAYPGTRSWVLGVFPNKKFRSDAEELAEFASTECDLPIRDDLAR